jgi:cytochrome oxidase Cu insertion factor (SCO1/SenC/PrrC family)
MKRLLTALVLTMALAYAVNRPAPKLAFTLIDGTSTQLSAYRGKVVLLEFGLTTCPACQNASQVVERLYKDYSPRGMQALFVAVDRTDLRTLQARAVDFTKKYGLTFPTGFAQQEVASEFTQLSLMSIRFPQLAVIGRDGVIYQQMQGMPPNEEQELRVLIEKLLKSK